MTYTYADSKSDQDLASYQSVRGADIRAIGTAIKEATPIDQLHADFVRPAADANSNSVDNTLEFLHAIDFIERPSERTVEPIRNQPFADQRFEIRVLHHISQQTGAQEHFRRIHDAVVAADTEFYEKRNLKEDLERDHDEYPFDWTVNKVEAWYNLTAPLGLVSVRDNEEILTSPAPGLVYDLLALFRSQESSSNLREALDWIEKEFFDCYASRGGYPRVHQGLSNTFDTMLKHDVLTVGAPSDATREVEIPSADGDRVSRFELADRPTRPAYRYPLVMNEGVSV